MVKKTLKSKDSVVKIDSQLLERVKEFIQREENRLKFVNKKQFIDIAVYEFLSKMEEGEDEK
ncbi:MAG: hypothetical protein ABIB79_03285 [archaeon]